MRFISIGEEHSEDKEIFPAILGFIIFWGFVFCMGSILYYLWKSGIFQKCQ